MVPANPQVLTEILEAIALVKSYRQKVRAVKAETLDILKGLEEEEKLKPTKKLAPMR